MTFAQVSRPAGVIIDMQVMGCISVEMKQWLSVHEDPTDRPRYRPIFLVSVRPIHVSNLAHDVVS